MTESKPAADVTVEDDVKPFATFLIEHARGRTHDELSRKLRDLLEAVEETGKGGTITYTVKITPEPKADHAVIVTDNVKVSTPSLDRPASIFFVDDRYRLVRNDPRQLTFDRLGEDG